MFHPETLPAFDVFLATLPAEARAAVAGALRGALEGTGTAAEALDHAALLGALADAAAEAARAPAPDPWEGATQTELGHAASALGVRGAVGGRDFAAVRADCAARDPGARFLARLRSTRFRGRPAMT